jgi:hypothetical protein
MHFEILHSYLEEMEALLQNYCDIWVSNLISHTRGIIQIEGV